MSCSCSSKIKCLTNKCECKNNSINCTKNCTCSLNYCQNGRKIDFNERVIQLNIPQEAYINKTKSIPCIVKPFQIENSNTKTASNLINDEIEELSHQIKEQINNKISDKRNIVLEYRDGFDIYTNKSKIDIVDPHVDHIIEKQMIAYATAKSLNNKLNNGMIEPLKQSFNRNYNYNVTESKINISKGACVRSFLTEGMYEGYPLRAVVLGKYCEKYMKPISNAMIDSHNSVDDSIRSSRRTDNYVTGNDDFIKIADELENLLEKMDLNCEDDDDSTIRLRNNKIVNRNN